MRLMSLNFKKCEKTQKWPKNGCGLMPKMGVATKTKGVNNSATFETSQVNGTPGRPSKMRKTTKIAKKNGHGSAVCGLFKQKTAKTKGVNNSASFETPRRSMAPQEGLRKCEKPQINGTPGRPSKMRKNTKCVAICQKWAWPSKLRE